MLPYCVISFLERRCCGGVRHGLVEIPGDHGQRPAGKIAKVIRQVGVIALYQRVKAEGAVLAKNNLAQQKIAQRVITENVNHRLRAHNVAAGLGHLAFFEQQPTVRNHRFGEGNLCGKQEGRPVHTVKPDDLFPDHVDVRRPVAVEFLLRGFVFRAESNRGAIVTKRVKPDVNHVLWVAGNRDAPFERAPADGEIAQAALHKSDDLVAARFWTDKVRLLFVQLQQLVRERRELEKVIIFADCLGGSAAFRTRRSGPGGVHV